MDSQTDAIGALMIYQPELSPMISTVVNIPRREALRRCGLGLGVLGLAGLLPENKCFAAEIKSSERDLAGSRVISPLAPKRPHFEGRAKHVVHLFMNGGPS